MVSHARPFPKTETVALSACSSMPPNSRRPPGTESATLPVGIGQIKSCGGRCHPPQFRAGGNLRGACRTSAIFCGLEPWKSAVSHDGSEACAARYHEHMRRIVAMTGSWIKPIVLSIALVAGMLQFGGLRRATGGEN